MSKSNCTCNCPRPEYPRPQMVRDSFLNLNGEWEFEIDHGNSGIERGLQNQDNLASKIIVPFCPESPLSGVNNKDFMNCVWYKKAVTLPADFADKTVILHFGAVDFFTTVWVNGTQVGTHRGGYTSFSFDITKALKCCENIITVCAYDDVRSPLQARGKQCEEFYSHACDYTRTTGIWQTVWLEAVSNTYIESVKYTPDPENSCLYIEGTIKGNANVNFNCNSSFDGKTVGSASACVVGGRVSVKLDVSELHLWDITNPNLYDLTLTLTADNATIDTVHSYFGLRSVAIDGMAIKLNGKAVFQRLILDQGFYPDGIYTAPTDEALKRDITLSMDMGFNGARMHEKVFDPRFIYWADKLGYLVWGEFPNWGLDITSANGLQAFLPEWIESVKRDFNSPALVGWCPFNETWDLDGKKQDNAVLSTVYHVTKALDNTRPVIDTSGNFHVATDIYDIHDYEQDPATFSAKFKAMREGGEPYETFPTRQKYASQPYFVSEYGGIWWNPDAKDEKSWGYGNRPTSEEEFLSRYEGLTTELLSNPYMCAFCYTQLTDVEQETNGLYTYERKAKFDPAIIKKINSQVAAIEK